MPGHGRGPGSPTMPEVQTAVEVRSLIPYYGRNRNATTRFDSLPFSGLSSRWSLWSWPCQHRRTSQVMEAPISTGLLGSLAGIGAVIILVLLNGFFVATEFALVSVRRTRIQHLAAAGNRRAESVLDRINHLDTYIAATQLGITIASLALGWIGEPAIAHLLEPAINALPFEVGSGLRHTISFIVAFSIVTSLHIVIGELAPKSLALQRPEETALAVSTAIHIFLKIFRPIIMALNFVGNQVVKLLGFEPTGGHATVQSADELLLSLSASREAGLVNQASHDLVGRAFSLNDLQARHVMVPRTEVTSLPIDSSLEDIVQLAKDSSFARVPVYDGDTDHMVGIIKTKRLLSVFLDHAQSRNENGNEETSDPFDIRDYMTEPMVVPENVPATEVLTSMRESHTQIAVVIDEYGGTAGIVTLQDIVEHLIGHIQDEVDPEAVNRAPTPEGELNLDGLMGLAELREVYGIDLDTEEYDVETLGGYVFFVLGRQAQIGDNITAPDGEVLEVAELDGLRVSRVRILPRQTAPEDAETDLALAGMAN
ncbi:MAG: hemolysin family protein [Thermomicrobiales bacterium]